MKRRVLLHFWGDIPPVQRRAELNQAGAYVQVTGGMPEDTPNLPTLPKVQGHELLGGPQMIQLRSVTPYQHSAIIYSLGMWIPGLPHWVADSKHLMGCVGSRVLPFHKCAIKERPGR